MTPSRSALEMHQDPCCGAKICAILIYSSAPLLQPSDCFEIRAGALIFVRVWFKLRVWSITGLGSLWQGSDKRGRWTPAIFGHGRESGLHLWYRGAFLNWLAPLSVPEGCRRRRNATMATVLGLWLVFSLISFDFYWFSLILCA